MSVLNGLTTADGPNAFCAKPFEFWHRVPFPQYINLSGLNPFFQLSSRNERDEIFGGKFRSYLQPNK